ncbi:hypothetical protein RJ640_011499 [Escallonia rubra]|uniref:Uncharacterized protein n=1 Tax=Escallonia rubra TaxID=112253 RepID=A0AA88RB73_9ASTE|nr:hypothetical protein RJ640_011499 [Escallonia rubra]
MEYYNSLTEMYVGNDVSPDFYAWKEKAYSDWDILLKTRGNYAYVAATNKQKSDRRDGANYGAMGDRIIKHYSTPTQDKFMDIGSLAIY